MPSAAASFEDVEQRSETLLRSVVQPLFAEVVGPPSPKDGAAVGARRRRAERRVSDALALRGVSRPNRTVRAWLAPILVDWSKTGFRDDFDGAARLDDELPAPPADPLAAHRAALVERFGAIELRGLQTSQRVWQSLEEAYVPLHVEDDAFAPEALQALPAGLRPAPRVPVERSVERAPRLLIVGAPGSGKSTVVGWLACALAKVELSALPEVVPFVVLVRSTGPEALTAAALAKASGLTTRKLEGLLRAGHALVLLDGLDESRDADALFAALDAFATRWPAARLIATTRPAAMEGRGVPAGFHSVRLAEMTVEEADRFVDRWCLAAEVSVRLERDRLEAETAATDAAADLKRRIHTSRPIERLAANPLMCGVLCVVHRFLGQNIPERRAALYEACANVLLYDWDRSKFPAGSAIGQLDAPQKRALLSGLAWEMHTRGVAEVTEAEVRAHFEERLPDLAGNVDAGRVLAEIRDRSGLLVERTPGQFGFSHLAFQEYFAARAVVTRGDVVSLAERAAEPWWHEVIVLAAGMPDVRPQELIRALLARDPEGEVGEGVALAAQCVGSAVEVPLKLRREVERRLAVLVPPTTLADFNRIVQVGSVLGPSLGAGLTDPRPEVRGYTVLVAVRLQQTQLYHKFQDMLGDHAPFEFDPEEVRSGAHAPTTVSQATIIAIASVDAEGLRAILRERIKSDSVLAAEVKLIAQAVARRGARPETAPPTPDEHTG